MAAIVVALDIVDVSQPTFPPQQTMFHFSPPNGRFASERLADNRMYAALPISCSSLFASYPEFPDKLQRFSRELIDGSRTELVGELARDCRDRR